MQHKLTNIEIAHKTENEGLGYMITDYMSEKDIKDPKLAKLWKQANKLLVEIQQILDDAIADEES